EVIDPGRFAWTDADWPGLGLEGRIIYEMHIGTFTPEGTWQAAAEQLPDLVDAGIDLIEMMPIAEFPGQFGWGYDGVDLFAPTRLYGRPDDLRAFIDAAHGLGLGVILDVVYNHFGPDGNYLKTFSRNYFTDRYNCEWGDAINFDGPDAGPVREFFIANACYWIDEFHFDGFRFDATQQIFDASRPGIIAEVVANARRTAGRRRVVMIAENEPQRAELLDPIGQGGSGLDGLWNDDFHHTMRVAITGRREAYFSDYRGSPQEIISAVRHGFLYQGQRSRWQNKPRGTPSFDIERSHLIGYIENHDQIANSAWGSRLIGMVAPGRYRAAMTLLMLGPWTPLIFQGQEFGASTPFLYFADHKPEIARFITKGRKEFLSQFPSIADGVLEFLAEPGREGTFAQSRRLSRERRENFRFYSFFKDLVALRRNDEVFSLYGKGRIEGAVLSDRAFALRFFGRERDRLLIVNFGPDLHLTSVPEPLLAPPRLHDWRLILSTEDPHYGGSGIARIQLDDGWRIPTESATVLASSSQSPES
ncbi:MAG: alpha-amylase family glycosyl hydrolase, partial [Solirubrobacterales bacterium]